jgi:predicted transcriptional regulator
MKKEVLTKLIDDKKAAILQVILNSKEEMYLKEISDKSNVSITSTFRILKELVDLKLIGKKEWKTSKVYFCQSNEEAMFLKELFVEEYDGLTEFVENVKYLPNVENIILHGAKKQSKASILVIGTDINPTLIEPICQNIKDKGFEINFMVLAKNQYAQMTTMGLYSGEKKILS